MRHRAPLTLPSRGSAASHVWDGRTTTALALVGAVVGVALAPLVPDTLLMLAAAVALLLLAAWAWLTPPTAPAWVRTAHTAGAAPVVTLGTFAAESHTDLRLGSIALLCPVIVAACLRRPAEVLGQAVWAEVVFGAYLLHVVPPRPALVGVVVSATVMLMLVVIICGLRGRLDLVVADLRRQADTDALTGLRNRNGLRRAVTSGRQARAVLMLDLDHFKRVNDVYGHEAGDEVLAWFARLLREAAPRDVVSRHGGEEFVVHHTGALDPLELRARGEVVRAWVEVESVARGLPVTVSIGGASSHDADLAELLRAADAALYEAKASGRNAVRLAPDPHQAVHAAPAAPVVATCWSPPG